MTELGVKGSDRVRMRKSAHPLGSISKDDLKEFRKTLSPREWKSLDSAYRWYRKTYYDEDMAEGEYIDQYDVPE